MRASTRKRLFGVAVLAGLVCAAVASKRPAYAGGPLFVGGTGGLVDGQPFTWDTATEIQYRTDGDSAFPNSVVLGTLTKSQADTRVAAMFQVWEDVPTATIGYNRAGDLLSVTDHDVNTLAEFDTVEDTCRITGTQNPIVYDRDGSLFTALGFPPNVIGFAGACRLDLVSGVNRILNAEAALNGEFQDGDLVLDLTADEFNQAFTHEFGHLSGLDHSQINLEVLDQPGGACIADDLAGLPLMFPSLHCQARVSELLPPLAPDDLAWISSLYPSGTFSTSFRKISGRIFFSDGVTQVQGANVIARQVNDPGTPAIDESRRNAVSVVSGYLFTGNHGQSVTANYLPCVDPDDCKPNGFFGNNSGGSQFGSRDTTLIGFYEIPLTPGDYTVEVESIDPAWVGGSGVGPLGNFAGDQIPLPGPPEFWNLTETENDDPAASDPITVAANAQVQDINIRLNGTPDRFDIFESAGLWLPEPPAAWLREKRPPAFLVVA